VYCETLRKQVGVTVEQQPKLKGKPEFQPFEIDFSFLVMVDKQMPSEKHQIKDMS